MQDEKKQGKSGSGVKQVKSKNNTTNPCISLSLTVLGLFVTLEDAAVRLNGVAQSLENEQTKMITVLSDYKTVLYPRLLHKMVIELGLPFRKHQYLQKRNIRLFLINSHSK